jgi:hypothetical protein
MARRFEPYGPDLFTPSAVKSQPVARRAGVRVSAEAVERSRRATAEVMRSFAERESDSQAGVDVVPAPVLGWLDVVELLKLGVVVSVNEKARQGFSSSIRDGSMLSFRGWRLLW